MVMDFKFLVVNFLFFSYLVLPDVSVDAADQVGAGAGAGPGPGGLPDMGSIAGIGAGAGGAGADVMQCMQSLLPCKPHLKSASPPASCCGPLKDMLTKDSQCLCKVFGNPEVLKSLNLTQDEALKLPKACGTDADISKCSATSPSSSPAMPAGGASSANDTAGTPPPNSAGNRIPQVLCAEFGLMSLLVTSGLFLV